MCFGKAFRVQAEYCFSIWTVHLVAGRHAVGDQSTGAAKGGGETAGTTARERQHRRTPEKQVFESEGRRRERILLFLFQRQITERSGSGLNGRSVSLYLCHCDVMLPDIVHCNALSASTSEMFTDLIFERICIYVCTVYQSFLFRIYIKNEKPPRSLYWCLFTTVS